MAWKCSTCGNENTGDSILKCACGHVLPADDLKKKECRKYKKKLTRSARISLVIIGLTGLTAGYIYVPIIAFAVEVFLTIGGCFIPDQQNYETELHAKHRPGALRSESVNLLVKYNEKYILSNE